MKAEEKKEKKTKWIYDLNVDFDRDTLLAMTGGVDPFETFGASNRISQEQAEPD